MKFRLFGALLILVAPIFVVPIVAAQQSVAVAPIPAPILSAKKVFLANGGADLVSAKAFEEANQDDEPYDSTYAALQAWGHWQLVSAPENADLVLVVRFTAPVENYSHGMPLTYTPQIRLTIYDGKTHFPLWTLTQPFGSAFRKGSWLKNYKNGIAELTAKLKLLTTPAKP